MPSGVAGAGEIRILCQNLPPFLVLAPQMPYAGTQVWASDFLPGEHQGTSVLPGSEPIANLVRRVPTARGVTTLDKAVARK